MNGTAQSQYTIQEKQQAMCHAHIEVGFQYPIHILQGHRQPKQQIADALQDGDVTEESEL